MKVKKRKTRFYTFLLIPDNERATHSVKLRTSVLRFLIIFAVITFLLIAAGAASYWKMAAIALDYNDLLEENTRMKTSLERVQIIQQDIDKLKMVDRKLRSSLSGYISMKGEKKSDLDNILTSTVDNRGGIKYDRSIFTTIPTEIPVEGFITRGFKTTSILKTAHTGIDIAGKVGSPIKSTADGVVMFSGWTFEGGNVVIVKHKYNFFSFYKHNMQNLCQELEYVKKGQVIALLGDTGQITSGAHLHFEIWKGSKPIDPMQFLQMN